jgi:hypothetical protein
VPRSVPLTLTIPILLLVSTTSCATMAPAPTAQPTSVPTVVSSSPTPETLHTPSATPVPGYSSEAWNTYSNSEYGFSVSFPAYLEITPDEDTPTLYIGEQIHVWISDVNPLECRGDCLLVEETAPATVAGLEATKVAGYMGAIGGSIPQRYLRYIIRHDNRYYVFTLFALSFHARSNDMYTIWPLGENDVTLFEQVLETFKFAN